MKSMAVQSTLASSPSTLLLKKNQQIEELTRTIESLNEKIQDIPRLEKSLGEAKADKKRSISLTRQAGRRLSVSRKANEQKIVGLIKTGTNWSEDRAHLAWSHAGALNDEEFTIDTSNDSVIPKDNTQWNEALDFRANETHHQKKGGEKGIWLKWWKPPSKTESKLSPQIQDIDEFYKYFKYSLS